MDILDDMGVSKLSGKVFFKKKWTTPLSNSSCKNNKQIDFFSFSLVKHGQKSLQKEASL